jgi:macrolide-specific efflux system membrane fusion protein
MKLLKFIRHITPKRRSHRWMLGAVLAMFGMTPFLFGHEPPQLPTEAVKETDVVQIVQAAGVVVPRVQVDVGAQVSGEVRTIHIELGQQVEAGQTLVTLDPDTARSDVRVAEAQMAEQRAQIQAKRVLLQLSSADAERQRRVLSAGGTTDAAVQRAEAEQARLQAELVGLTASLDRLDAEIVKRRLALSRTEIGAPVAGIVVDLLVAKGQTVNATQITPVVATLANLDQMTVRAHVAEADIGHVRVGQRASFTMLSGDADRFEGHIRVIQPTPERSGSASFYNVLFEVDNRARRLLPQMTVNVRIETGAAMHTAAIPISALGGREADGRHVVYVLDSQGKPKRRLVRIGLQDDFHVQIVDGLKPGERILQSPPEPADSLGGG